MSNSGFDGTSSSGLNGKLTFPSLENSPLWDENFKPPQEAEPEQTPPLFIIRERFPRIANAIELMWGTREMTEYFDRLILNDRGDRAGFPPEVMEAILKLNADHQKRFRFPPKDGAGNSVWGADPYQKHVFRE